MAIPVISDIIQTFRDAVRWFSDHTPPIIKYTLLFLFVILFLQFVLPLALGFFGYHCSSNGIIHKMPMSDFADNYKIYSKDINELNSTEIDVGLEVFGYELDVCVIEVFMNGTPPLYNYTRHFSHRAECNNCTTGIIGIDQIRGQWCDGDVFYQDPDPCYGFCWFDGCDIPVHYYWNDTTKRIECLDTDFCGDLTGAMIVDQILIRNNAKPLYTDPDDRSIEGLMGIGCNDNYKPVVEVFNIDLFNYRLWVFLFILIALVKVWMVKTRRD